MHIQRIIALLLGIATVVCAETAPWQDGTVLEISRGSEVRAPSNNRDAYVDVSVQVGNVLYVVRPLAGFMDSFNAGLAGQPIPYADSINLNVGAAVKIAVFSNGTASLLTARNQRYGCTIVRQGLTASSESITNGPAFGSTRNEWKRTDQPDEKFTFTLSPDFVYGERLGLPFGAYVTIDTKWTGQEYLGTVRIKMLFGRRSCEWTEPIGLSFVRDERIEGRWQWFPRDAKLNEKTCAYSLPPVWRDITWVNTSLQ